MKQCMSEPVGRFRDEPQKGDRLPSDQVRSRISAYSSDAPAESTASVHLSDLSWTLPAKTSVRDYKKGADVERSCSRIESSASASRSSSSSSNGDTFTLRRDATGNA